MKATTLQTKAPASSHANAQNNGAAASPPRYGIDFLDRQTEQTTYHTGLPDELKSGVEALSGLSMANVQVHYNSSKPAQLQALAYTQGSDIHVAPGQERHLAHEAWHVVQQAQGRVKPTMQMKLGVPINDDQGLEREADAMGKRVLERGRETSNPGLDAAVQHNRQPINPTTHNAPAQRVRARSLSDTLATRIGYSDRARGEVVGAVPADALRLRVYRLARDHNWNIRAADLQDRYRADVPNALELLQIIVRAAGQADTEAEQAQSFEDSVEFNTRSNDNISAILRHYQRKAANQAARSFMSPITRNRRGISTSA
ncbi:DUF4157 domain-containing protein [Methylogaea oryzae]|uniref:eCIS core domain-containing protein n=1 Tax=Methylogaea oryzae TaxID=1295382 RepID=UPI0009EA633E|nr:DUF4157 domain-containing protein [Methylogaea oryzae]